jgi:hypothetical protein
LVAGRDGCHGDHPAAPVECLPAASVL